MSPSTPTITLPPIFKMAAELFDPLDSNVTVPGVWVVKSPLMVIVPSTLI